MNFDESRTRNLRTTDIRHCESLRLNDLINSPSLKLKIYVFFRSCRIVNENSTSKSIFVTRVSLFIYLFAIRFVKKTFRIYVNIRIQWVNVIHIWSDTYIGKNGLKGGEAHGDIQPDQQVFSINLEYPKISISFRSTREVVRKI